MLEVALIKPLRDPEKQQTTKSPALIILKTIRLREGIQFRFSEFTEQPEFYTVAKYAFSIRGTLEFVYVLFELQFKGDKKRRYYRFTMGTFQQCFDEYMEKQNGTTAFASIMTQDEYSANMRAQALTEYLMTRDQYSTEESLRGPLDTFALDSYSIMIQPEMVNSCKRRLWRDPRRSFMTPAPRL